MDSEVRKELPANIQKMYIAYQSEESSIRRMELMLDVFKQTVQFFGCVFLSEYFWDREKKDEKVNGQIRQMVRPSLGTWYDLVRTYAKTYCRKDQSWLDGFWQCYKEIYAKKVERTYHGRFQDEKSQSGSPFDEIIALRNRIAHGAQFPDPEEAEEILSGYSLYLEDILIAFMPFFRRYKVAKCVETDDYDEETGTDCWIAYFDIIQYEIVENENYRIRWPKDTKELGMHPESFFDLEDTVSDEKTFVLLDMENTQRILRFSEILIELLEGDLDGQQEEHEDYLIYDGYGNRDVTYVGVRDRCRIERYLYAVRTRFTECGSNLHWSHHDFDMPGFRKYVNELSRIAVDINKDSGKYCPDVYIQRSCDNVIEEFLDSDKTTILIQAEAGAGKTCLLCHTAEILMNDRERNAVYFYNGNHLDTLTDSDNKLFKRLERECLEDGVFLSGKDFLDYVQTKNPDGIRLVLIVDAVNEAVDTRSILHEIDEITTQCGNYPWLKIIVSIRSISYQILRSRMINDIGKAIGFLTTSQRFFSTIQDGRIIYHLVVERWNLMQVADAYERYKSKYDKEAGIPLFEALDDELKKMLTNPLNMRLFFDNSLLLNPDAIHSEYDLFAALDIWSAADPIDCTRKMQSKLVASMLKHRKNTIDADEADTCNDELLSGGNIRKSLFVLTPLERLLDKGILFEKDIPMENGIKRVVAFVYQKYLEYLVLKTMDPNISLESLVKLMIDARDWEEFPEAYLAYSDALVRFADCAKVLKAILEKLNYVRNECESIRPTFVQYCIRVLTSIDAKMLDLCVHDLVRELSENDLASWCVEMVELLRRQTQSVIADSLAAAVIDNDSIQADVRREILYHRAMISQNRSQYADTIAYLEEAKDGETDLFRLNRIVVQLAKTKRKNGEVGEAEALLKSITETGTDETPFYAYALIQRGLCCVERNNYDAALGDYESALRIAKIQRDYHTVAYDLLGISAIHRHNNETEMQKKVLLEIYEISGKYGYLDLLSDCLHALAMLYLADKDYEKTGKYTDQAIFLWERSGHYEGLAVMYILRAIVHTIRNEKEDVEIIKLSKEKAEEYHSYIKNDAVEREYSKYKEMLISDAW